MQEIPIEQRTKEDYLAAITAENKLSESGVEITRKYATQAVNRSMLTREETEKIM